MPIPRWAFKYIKLNNTLKKDSTNTAKITRKYKQNSIKQHNYSNAILYADADLWLDYL